MWKKCKFAAERHILKCWKQKVTQNFIRCTHGNKKEQNLLCTFLIILPTVLATLLSSVIGIILVKIFIKKGK